MCIRDSISGLYLNSSIGSQDSLSIIGPISSSISHFTQSFSSGSTKFGDTSDDIHAFTGSVNVLGSINGAFTGSVSITDGAIGSDLQPVTLFANSGEIDNVIIGSEASAAGTFTTLNVVSGILPDNNDGAFIGCLLYTSPSPRDS